MTYCLHGKTICPSGQQVHYRHDSVIQCGGEVIPVLSAHNTQDGIPRAVAPASCPLTVKEHTPKTNKVNIVDDFRWRKKRKPPNRTLNDEQVIEIRKRAASGEKFKDIAASFHICPASVGKIYRREQYRDVV